MFDWLNNKKSKQEPLQVTENIISEPKIEKSLKEIELEEYLGKLVICVSNELDNVKVGYGKEIVFITQAKTPMLIVYDLVDKKATMPLSKMYSYTDQRFNALNKLDPNERISIVYEAFFGDETVDKKLIDGRVIYPAEEWAEKVNVAIEEWKQANKVVKKIKP